MGRAFLVSEPVVRDWGGLFAGGLGEWAVREAAVSASTVVWIAPSPFSIYTGCGLGCVPRRSRQAARPLSLGRESRLPVPVALPADGFSV